jgi:hypothetical protein
MVAPLSFPPGYRAYVGAFLSLAILDFYMVGWGKFKCPKCKTLAKNVPAYVKCL